MELLIDVLKKAEAYLAAGGVERPKLDAEWIVSTDLKIERLQLFLNYEKMLDEAALQSIREKLKRRKRREPLQYIIGSVPFRDIELDVAPGSLIPRPETEELLEWLIPLLGKWQSPRVIDLGTGSGAIALSIAKEVPGARVLAIDYSSESLNLAKKNAEKLELRSKVSFRKGDWLSGFDREVDLIVSNPPYLTEEEWQVAAPEVREFEPKSALVSEDCGMSDIKQILSQAYPILAVGGLVALETGISHGQDLLKFGEGLGYKNASIRHDLSGRNRFLEFWK